MLCGSAVRVFLFLFPRSKLGSSCEAGSSVTIARYQLLLLNIKLVKAPVSAEQHSNTIIHKRRRRPVHNYHYRQQQQ